MQTFGVRGRGRFEKVEIRPLDRPDPLNLAPDVHRRRLEPDLGAVVLAELRDEFAVMRLHALEALQEIDVKVGAAELAVGDPLQADVLLSVHDLADAFVLDRVQVGRREPAGGEALARCLAVARGEESCRRGRRGTADRTWSPPLRAGDNRLRPMLSRRRTFWQPRLRPSRGLATRVVARSAGDDRPHRRAAKNVRSIAAASLSRTPP